MEEQDQSKFQPCACAGVGAATLGINVQDSTEVGPSRPRATILKSSEREICCICRLIPEAPAFAYSCMHRFCFDCLLTWSKVRAVCPLCQRNFLYIFHNVRAIDDYDVYKVKPKKERPPIQMLDLDEIGIVHDWARIGHTMELEFRNGVAASIARSVTSTGADAEATQLIEEIIAQQIRLNRVLSSSAFVARIQERTRELPTPAHTLEPLTPPFVPKCPGSDQSTRFPGDKNAAIAIGIDNNDVSSAQSSQELSMQASHVESPTPGWMEPLTPPFVPKCPGSDQSTLLPGDKNAAIAIGIDNNDVSSAQSSHAKSIDSEVEAKKSTARGKGVAVQARNHLASWLRVGPKNSRGTTEVQPPAEVAGKPGEQATRPRARPKPGHHHADEQPTVPLPSSSSNSMLPTSSRGRLLNKRTASKPDALPKQLKRSK